MPTKSYPLYGNEVRVMAVAKRINHTKHVPGAAREKQTSYEKILAEKRGVKARSTLTYPYGKNLVGFSVTFFDSRDNTHKIGKVYKYHPKSDTHSLVIPDPKDSSVIIIHGSTYTPYKGRRALNRYANEADRELSIRCPTNGDLALSSSLLAPLPEVLMAQPTVLGSQSESLRSEGRNNDVVPNTLN